MAGHRAAGGAAAPARARDRRTPYSPDSWALWELAQSVTGDFYRIVHWRSYANDLPYAASFPPLTPVLIACLDALFGTGPRSGLYLAFASFAGFALVSEAIGRRMTRAPWLGLGAALVLLTGPNMVLIELSAGRTIPLHLLLCAGVLLALLRTDRITVPGAAAIGLIAGLAALNRFDALLLPVAAALAVGWLTRSPARALASVAASAVTVAPWAAWSLATFGTPLATDNAGIAAALDPRAYVTDWWPTPQPTLADDPLAWAAKVAGHAAGLLRTGAGLLASPLGLVAAAFLALPAALAALHRDGAQSARTPWPLAGFAALAGLMLAAQVATGYLEHRYFALLTWAVLLALACRGIGQGRSLHQRRIVAKGAFALAVLAAGGVAAGPWLAAPRASAASWAAFENPADVRALKACLEPVPEARILVIGGDEFAARAGALGGLSTMMEPRNMAEGRLGVEGSRAFARRWQVSHVLLRDPARAGWAATTFAAERVPGCPLPLHRLPG